jgi:hypothetical protein
MFGIALVISFIENGFNLESRPKRIYIKADYSSKIDTVTFYPTGGNNRCIYRITGRDTTQDTVYFFSPSSYFLYDSLSKEMSFSGSIVIEDNIIVPGKTHISDLGFHITLSKKANNDTLVVRKDNYVMYFLLVESVGRKLPETLRKDSLRDLERKE